MPNPIDALKQAVPPTTDPAALIAQRQGVNSAMSGQPPPQMAPFRPQPQPPGPVSHGGFTFGQQTPDIEGLVQALKGGGMTGSRTGDIDLGAPQAEAPMDFDALMRRAQAIR